MKLGIISFKLNHYRISDILLQETQNINDFDYDQMIQIINLSKSKENKGRMKQFKDLKKKKHIYK